jgi:hypothetical protein
MKTTKIQVTKATGAILSSLPNTMLHVKEIGNYVSITPLMTLELIGEKNDKVYFKVHYLFFEKINEAPGGSIVYFTKNNYSKMAYKYV